MNVYRVICDSEIGSRYLEQLTERGGYITHVEEIAPASGDYQEMVPASELVEAQRVQQELREALVRADERSSNNRAMAYDAKKETAGVLDAVRDYIIDSGEESFPDGFVDAMVALGMEPLFGIREFTLSFTIKRSFSIALNDCPAGVDDDTITDLLGQIDICGDEDESDIQISLQRMLSRTDWADNVEVEASCAQYDVDDVEFETA